MTDTEVWLVSTGSYSDYSVDSLWTTEELAKAYAAGLTGVDVGVEGPFTLRDELPQRVTWFDFSAQIGRTQVEHQRFVEHTGWADPYTPTEAAKARIERGWQPTEFVGLSVLGTDRERVLKVVSERTAMILADFDVLLAELA